jgi:lysozyme
MTPSIECQNLIKISEGLRLEAYRDTGGVWTIGWGHTGPDIHSGLQWKQAQADIALYTDTMDAWRAIKDHAGPCTQGQCDALTAFAFNLGAGALLSSTLLKLHRAGQHAKAQAEFVKWDHGKVDGREQELTGLRRRRIAESELYGKD